MKQLMLFSILTTCIILAACDNANQPMQQTVPASDSIRLRTVLYRPGDYGSKNYRIPAIITAKDGSLVVATDKRKNNDRDLPEDIDIIISRSTDGGRTWSEPYTLAEGKGRGQGFGDCALVHTNDEGGLLAAFVGGMGLFQGTPEQHNRSYIARSYDNGVTWTEPQDVTDVLFGVDCPVKERQSWRGSFFASGNGLLTSSGRIMFVIAVLEDESWSLSNYAVYSDDNGMTWLLSGRASQHGDEAKMVELADGRLLMSIRHEGERWYNISEDGGETWQPETSAWHDLIATACDGDIIRYSSVNEGDEKNVLLHSLPRPERRENVTVYVSYDEGQTWPVSKCIVPYDAAYSSLCILPDHSIGLYVEESDGDTLGYSMVFYNFGLEWLESEKE